MGKALRSIGRALGLLKRPTPAADKELIETALKRFKLAGDAEKDQREHELNCLRMCDPAQQWNDNVKSERGAEERPCMTEDRINPMVLVVCNGLRQNRASVQVNPVDDGADVDTAEVIQGLIRHITYDSSAEIAYDTASTSMVRTGRGFYRIVAEYESPESFDQQVLRTKAIPNHHMVYMDPNSVEADYSDAAWAMIVEDMDRETFKQEYPDAQSTGLSGAQWSSVGDDLPEWYSDDHIRVVEYFYKEPKKIKLVRLSDGTVTTDDQLPEGVKAIEGAVIYPGIMGNDALFVDAVRDSVTHQVKWVKITGLEVLERVDWPGRIIPIIPLLGKELIINNKRRFFGVVAGMIDPQKRFNWLLSIQIEALNQVPKTPWVAVEGSLVNPNAWSNAHKRPVGTLYYKQTVEGQPVNMPQRPSAGVDLNAVNTALSYAQEGFKGTSGLYNPSMGASEGGQSGVAIRAQQAQGDMSTAHFQDAVVRARRLEGRIYLELIPHYYDTERVLRIIGDDDTAKQVRINEEIDGLKKFNLTQGKYDLTVSAGPSYSTRRQENLAVLLSLSQTIPAISQFAPDLIASQADVPVAKALAKRLKAALPSQVTQEEGDGNGNGQPPIGQIMASYNEARQIMQGMAQEMEKLTAQLNDKQADRDNTLQVARINAAASIKRAAVTQDPGLLGPLLEGYEDEVPQGVPPPFYNQAPVPYAGNPAGMGPGADIAGDYAGMEQ